MKNEKKGGEGGGMWEGVQALLSVVLLQELLNRKKNKSVKKLLLFNSLGKN